LILTFQKIESSTIFSQVSLF